MKKLLKLKKIYNFFVWLEKEKIKAMVYSGKPFN
jgi:hypothetical protein